MRIGSEAGDLGVDDIRSIHGTLTVVPPLDRIAGEFSEEQGWIGGSSPPHATYVPPPHEHVPGLTADLCDFMNRDDVFAGRSRVATINGLEHLAQVGVLTLYRNQRKGDSWEARS